MKRTTWSARLVALLLGVMPASALFSFPVSAASPAPSPFGHVCSSGDGVRFCPTTTLDQRVPSFDGVPLDVDVTLPPDGNGPWPTILMMHGWSADKTEDESTVAAGLYAHYNNSFYARRGYAVVTYSHRGFGNSCGAIASRTPACARGWVHVADQRFEARDAQVLLGDLVDEGVADPRELGVTGISYGGGLSLELAYLRDRVRLPDGSFTPWRSPAGRRLSVAAAWARAPWSDLVSALLPNGRFIDGAVSGPTESRQPAGVELQSYVAALFGDGIDGGYYAPPGAESPGADPTAWVGTWGAGEPYGAANTINVDEIAHYHQAYGLSGTPAPLLLQSGWTDDLFPVEQSLRVYNSLRATHPDAQVSLQVADSGHPRATDKPATDLALDDQGARFFDARLMASAEPPSAGSVTAYTQTCPQTVPDTGPLSAPTWQALHPHTVSFGAPAMQTVLSTGGNPATAAAFDPVVSGIAVGPNAGLPVACATVPAQDDPGTAVCETTSTGFTLMGLPTVTLSLQTAGLYGQLDSRLWDVLPDGTQRLVTRGVYRLSDGQQGTVRFQLHGNAYAFAPGDTVKLELLGQDAPYYRASNGAFMVAVSQVQVTLPTT